jgi:hypothetical protein
MSNVLRRRAVRVALVAAVLAALVGTLAETIQEQHRPALSAAVEHYRNT